MALSSLEKYNLAMTQDLFQFRDFTMAQAPSGQRVNTDSCVFGDLIGEPILESPQKILDIGTGTGVLALMLAQKFPQAQITGVEPELEIARVTATNFENSLWSKRLQLLTLRAQDLKPEEHGLYDFVLCNPPYFQNSMLSDDRLRTVARHNTDLLPLELYTAMKLMMTKGGTAWVSFPEDSTALWIQSGKASGLVDIQHIVVRDHPQASPHMTIVGWTHPEHSLAASEKSLSFIDYRKAYKGEQSDWMRSFRDRWYPEKYNRNFK